MTHRENPEYGAMVARMLRAYGKRVGEADPIDFVELVALRYELEEAITAAVAGQIKAGFSWREVAEGLGVSKEAAWMRYKSQLSAGAGDAASNTA